MPTYTYRNIKTGETWEELRKISEMMNGVDDENVELLISSPRLADPTLLGNTKGQDFHDKVIAPRKHLHPGLK